MARIYNTIAEVKEAHPRYSDERARIVFENSQAKELRRKQRETAKEQDYALEHPIEIILEPEYDTELVQLLVNLCDFCWQNFKTSAYNIVEPVFAEKFKQLLEARKVREIPEVMQFFKELMDKRASFNLMIYGEEN